MEEIKKCQSNPNEETNKETLSDSQRKETKPEVTSGSQHEETKMEVAFDSQVENVPSNKKKVCRRVVGFIIFLLVIIYGVGVYYFSGHLMINSFIKDVEYSFLSEEAAVGKLRTTVEQTPFSLEGRENTHAAITGKDFGLSFDVETEMHQIFESQNSWLWLLIWDRKDYLVHPRNIEFNEQQLQDCLLTSSLFDKAEVHKGENAYIGEYQAGKGFEMIPEYPGTELNPNAVLEVLKKHILSMEFTINLDQEGCYIEPVIKQNDLKLNRRLNLLNTMVSAKITYDWNGAEIILDGDQIAKWITVGDTKNEFDKEGMRAWIEQNALANDTFKDKREFTTIDGEVKELKCTNFGWKTDVDDELEMMEADIRQGNVVEREPKYYFRAYKKGADDMGDSFVEIDLSKQHLYLWMNGEVILETDFVSGNMSNGNGTPSGIYGITYKEKDAVLRGQNYTTSVHFWMPFNRNVGMHDATWRKEFGGDIYLTSGSHGCINLPYKMAKEIYEYMEKKFPVVCYY